MKRLILLLVAVALLMSTEGAFALERVNHLEKSSSTPRSLYIDYIPEKLSSRTRLVKVVYTQARDAIQAQEKYENGNATTVFKRRKKKMRITGLKEEETYCFKAWRMAPEEFKYLAPIEDQVFDKDSETEWLCTTTSDRIRDELPSESEQDQDFQTYQNDLLIHSITTREKLLTRDVNDRNSSITSESGNLVSINVMNAGELSAVQPVDLKITCAHPSARQNETIVMQSIQKTIPSKRILRVNAFLKRHMTQACNQNMLVELVYEDEVPGNNNQKFTISKLGDRYHITR